MHRFAEGVLLLALGTGLVACTSTPNPIPAGTDTAYYGHLTVGEKFGTTVGQSTANLQDVLWAQGYGFEGEIACTSDIGNLLGCRANERYLAFQPVEIGRKGHVYVKVDNDRVSQIGWEFKIVPYLDG